MNVFIVVYVQEMDAKSHIRSCTGCARRKFQNFAIFGAKHLLAPMAFKHFTPNFERARTFTFVYVHILDVGGCAPPATPTFGCARRNGKRPTRQNPPHRTIEDQREEQRTGKSTGCVRCRLLALDISEGTDHAQQVYKSIVEACPHIVINKKEARSL